MKQKGNVNDKSKKAVNRTVHGNHAPDSGLTDNSLDLSAKQSDLCNGSTDLRLFNELRLFGAREAAQILAVGPNIIYALWKNSMLDFWCINGTRKTNLQAIGEFLERSKNSQIEFPESC